ncbi:hypothetical protein R84B8_02131 [Treponema sp. R8-4-B8]
MLKRIAIAVIIGISLTLSVAAATVSFYVIETGINEDFDIKQSQSIQWENAFMDVFFDAGYIISNAPIMRLEKIPSDVLQVIDINEAVVYGIDYMLIVLLDYKKELNDSSEVSFFIYKVTRKEKVFEKKILIKRESSQDDYNNMKSIAKGFVPYIGE